MAVILPRSYGGFDPGPGIEALLKGIGARMSPEARQKRILMESGLEKYISPYTGQPYPDTPPAIRAQLQQLGIHYDPNTANAFVLGGSDKPTVGSDFAQNNPWMGRSGTAVTQAPQMDYNQIIKQLMKLLEQRSGVAQTFASGGISSTLNELGDLIRMDRGGKLPPIGQPPGVEGDVVHGLLSPGEIVLNPTVSSMFPQLNHLNKLFPNAANPAVSPGVRRDGDFAQGGIINTTQDQVSDPMSLYNSLIQQFATPSAGTFSSLATHPINTAQPPAQTFGDGGISYKNYGPYKKQKWINEVEYKKNPNKYKVIDQKLSPLPAIGDSPYGGRQLLVEEKQQENIAPTPRTASPTVVNKPAPKKEEGKPSLYDIPQVPTPQTNMPAPLAEPSVPSVPQPQGQDISPLGYGQPLPLDWNQLLSGDPKNAIATLQNIAMRTRQPADILSTSPTGPSQQMFGELLNQLVGAQGAQQQGLKTPAVAAQSQAAVQEQPSQTAANIATNQATTRVAPLKATAEAEQFKATSTEYESLNKILSDPTQRAKYGQDMLNDMELTREMKKAQINEMKARAEYFRMGGSKAANSSAKYMQLVNFARSASQMQIQQAQKVLANKTSPPKPEVAANARRIIAMNTIKVAALSNPDILNNPTEMTQIVGKTIQGGLFNKKEVPDLTVDEVNSLAQQLKQDDSVRAAIEMHSQLFGSTTPQSGEQIPQQLLDAIRSLGTGQ